MNKDRDCGTCIFRDTSVLRKHLLSVHIQPWFCVTCKAVFNDQDKRDDHVRLRSCQENDLPDPPGLTTEQQTLLRQRGAAAVCHGTVSPEARRWFWFWETCFPGVRRPDGPYRHGPDAVVRFDKARQSFSLQDLLRQSVVRALAATADPQRIGDMILDDLRELLRRREEMPSLVLPPSPPPDNVAQQSLAILNDSSNPLTQPVDLQFQPWASSVGQNDNAGFYNEPPANYASSVGFNNNAGFYNEATVHYTGSAGFNDNVVYHNGAPADYTGSAGLDDNVVCHNGAPADYTGSVDLDGNAACHKGPPADYGEAASGDSQMANEDGGSNSFAPPGSDMPFDGSPM
ncbi:hypothetical protein QBC40DRAFT_256550 [Triangularia verruculosa]|uniref:Uncharacterized protein n=1 Tax=Triangularia verruculosa TaxID=2587418 RepID=A0AAN6XHR9_9PEZI|nr:hypothetical protein QBC40DRAFT_256550 [Triangularia verruculosa]